MLALVYTRLAGLGLPGILLPSRSTGYRCTLLPHSAWALDPYCCTVNALPAESFSSSALERLKREGRRNPRRSRARGSRGTQHGQRQLLACVAPPRPRTSWVRSQCPLGSWVILTDVEGSAC